MGIKNALAGVVGHRQQPEATTIDSPCDRLELRLAPYTVTATSIRIPCQRQAGSTLSTDRPSG